MAGIQALYSYENEVFRAYARYSTILAIKMFAVVFTTKFYRVKNKVTVNDEDLTTFGKGAKLGLHPDVERVRRAHLNDLENIIPFWIVGLLYVATGPQLGTALLCFRIFTVARIVHSFVYILAVRQPFRGLSFVIGLLITLFMALSVVKATF